MTSMRTYQRTFIKALLMAVLGCLPLTARALVGVDWTLQNLAPTSESFNGVARNGDAFAGHTPTILVAVGSHGLIVSASAAAGPWTVKNSNTLENLNAITWSGSPDGTNASSVNKFLAVGNNGTVLTSPDGATWTSVADATMKGVDFVTVFWTSSKFFIAGNSATGPVVYASTNADTSASWTKFPALTGTGLKVKCITGSLNTTVVVVTDKNVQKHSATLASGAWTVSTFPLGETAFQSMVYNKEGDSYVTSAIHAYNPQSIASPTTPTSWPMPLSQPDSFLNLTLNFSLAGTKIMGAGPNGVVWSSFQGTTWTSLGTTEPGIQLHGAVNFGSEAVAVGDSGRIYRYNGSAWTSVYSTGLTDSLTAVGNVGSTLVALGKNVSLVSGDGVTWTRNTPTIDATSVLGVGATLYATGTRIWSSTDGANWVVDTSTAPFIGRLNRLISLGGSNLLAVGVDTSKTALASMIYQFNGTGWSKVTLPAISKELRGAAASPTITLAVGDGGAVLVKNGTKWTPYTVALAAGENFSDVIYSGGQFVASTSIGGTWTSPDGTKWTKRQVSTTGGLNRLVSAAIGQNSVIIGVGGAGTTLRSFGGVYWFASNTGTAQRLTDAVWTGSQLVAVGDHGTIMLSAGSIPPRPLVKFSSGSSTVAEGAGTTEISVLISPPSPLPVTVSYTGSTSTTKTTTAATLGTTGTWDYSLPTVTTLTFPANSSTPLKILVKVNPDTADEPDETATISLTAVTGDAGIDSPFQHVLTITDDDVQPFIATKAEQPQNQLINVGSPLVLTATAGGAPLPTGVWKKNGTTITGATVSNTNNVSTTTFKSTYNPAATTHAGAYTIVLSNPSKPTGIISDVGQIGVVDNTQATKVVIEKGTLVLTVKAAGNGLTGYQWWRGKPTGSPVLLSNDTSPLKRITGVTTNTLTIKSIGMDETDTYFCKVTQTYTTGTPLAPQTVIGCTTDVGVINAKPIVTAPTLSATYPVVGELISLQPTATSLPYKWTIGGLPPGLSYDSATGLITGRALLSGLFHLTFTATNLLGTSPVVPLSLNIADLPDGVAGTYMGLAKISVATQAVDNLLGTRIDLTINPTSTFTAKITHGNVSASGTGALSYVAPVQGSGLGPVVTGSVDLKPTGFLPVTLSFTVQPTDGSPTANTIVFQVRDTATKTIGLSTSGWRYNTWNTSLPAGSGPANVKGLYNFALQPAYLGPLTGNGTILQDDLDLPQGYTAGTFTIDFYGSFNMVGMMGDGTPFTMSGFVNATGATPGEIGVPFFVGLYGNTTTKGVADGVMIMTMTQNQDTPPAYEWNALDGNKNRSAIQWAKTPLPRVGTTTPSGRLYGYGFGDNLNPPTPKILTLGVLSGSGLYTPPSAAAKEIVLDASTVQVNNLALGIHDGGIYTDDYTTVPKGHTPDSSLLHFPETQIAVSSIASVDHFYDASTLPYLSFDAAKGTFSGGFQLSNQDDPNKPNVIRTVTYSGYILGHRGFDLKKQGSGRPMQAAGTFTLSVLPSKGAYDLAGGVLIYRIDSNFPYLGP